jgi:hypothetical protein
LGAAPNWSWWIFISILSSIYLLHCSYQQKVRKLRIVTLDMSEGRLSMISMSVSFLIADIGNSGLLALEKRPIQFRRRVLNGNNSRKQRCLYVEWSAEFARKANFINLSTLCDHSLFVEVRHTFQYIMGKAVIG